jgi:integration host factor subunit alpha
MLTGKRDSQVIRRTVTLTRADIARAIQRELGLSHTKGLVMVEGIVERLAGALERGEYVKIVNFGTFHLNDKAARVGRNSRTGVEHEVSARRVVSFHPSVTLRERVAASPIVSWGSED